MDWCKPPALRLKLLGPWLRTESTLKVGSTAESWILCVLHLCVMMRWMECGEDSGAISLP